MNTEQLRYFVSVARYRNFTETAREFYVTQPAVTHQISALEREVGARLFLRTTRNVSLTRAGELFLEDAKRILDQEERALGRLRHPGGHRRGGLRCELLGALRLEGDERLRLPQAGGRLLLPGLPAGAPLPGQRRDRLRQAGHGALCLPVPHRRGLYV